MENKDEPGWFKKLKALGKKQDISLYLVQSVPVDYANTAKEAILAGAPDTKLDPALCEITEYYKSLEPQVLETMVLITLARHAGSPINWAFANGLHRSTPQSLLGLSEFMPDVLGFLKTDSIDLIETTGCIRKDLDNLECRCFLSLRKQKDLVIRKLSFRTKKEQGDTANCYVFCVLQSPPFLITK